MENNDLLVSSQNSKEVKIDIDGNFWEKKFTSLDLEKLGELGRIPNDLVESYNKVLFDLQNARVNDVMDLETKTLLKNLQEIELFSLLQKEKANHDVDGVKFDEPTLFNNVVSDENFGVARAAGDLVYHLSTLLEDTKLNNLYETLYETRGTTKNSKGEIISLTYSFNASSEEEAKKIHAEYKKTMMTKGLKVWMTYWLMANIVSRTEFSCPMIEIMKLMQDPERKTFFSVKEKKEHWALTKMLEKTKLSIERKVSKKGVKEKEVTQWAELPLLEILGGEKESGNSKNYPSVIAVRVLTPNTNNKKLFFAAIYKIATLQLHPNDTLMAFIFQTRASQMGRGSKELHFDWEYLFEIGNLQSTANTKKAIAKAQTRKKMDRFKECQIIKDWSEGLLGLSIMPSGQEKKIKRDEDE